MSNVVKESSSERELKQILDLRYHILRKPWDQPYESAKDEFEETSINAYIPDSDGNVIACARLQVNDPETGQIRYMAVREDFRGKGLGLQILSYLEQRARGLNLRKVQLQARENAVGFYSIAGYRTVEKTFLLWGQIQHFLMEKTL